MICFDSYEQLLTSPRKSLDQCPETIRQYQQEHERSDDYRQLAADFRRYERNEPGFHEERDNYYFYKYLKSLGATDRYTLPKTDGTRFEVNIPLFLPYRQVRLVDGSTLEMVDPRWHLAVSLCAWADAVNNHRNSEYIQQIKSKIGRRKDPESKTRTYRGIESYRNNVLRAWLEESRSES